MVSNKVTVISTYKGTDKVTVKITREENENGKLELLKANIEVFDGDIYLTPSELVSLTEILNYISDQKCHDVSNRPYL